MAYFLGKDVLMIIRTENTTRGIDVTASGTLDNSGSPTTIKNLSAPDFTTTDVIGDLTGLDLGIGTNDEDVSFMGANTQLKAEVRKETTVTTTTKKKNQVYDVLFNGDVLGNIGRWGVTGTNFRDGLTEPDITFGYRMYIALKDGSEIFAIKNAQMTNHTVTLNADGTQEETIEWASQVEPVIFTTSGATGIATPTTTAEL
mgnify:CR=1 FL=1